MSAPKPGTAASKTDECMSTSAAMTGPSVTDLERVVAYANRFSIKLFKNVSGLDPRSTVCVGPFSVFKALCMAYSGAREHTEHQMAKAFKVNKRFDMSGAFNSLLGVLHQRSSHVRQQTSTHVFLEGSLAISPHFESAIWRRYNAQVHKVNMREESDSVRESVNSQVDKDTMGVIPHLLVSGVLDGDTCAVFYDSLYVKASWEHVFPVAVAATEKHPYTITTNSRVGSLSSASEHSPELVRISGPYRHCRDIENKLLAVEVPLSSGDLSLVLFMADNAPSLRRFHKHLSLEQYDKLMDKLEATGEKISVLVPKMHVEETLQPSYALKHMGFLDLLDEHANLSGIAKDLFVSDMIHKVSLSIDSTGITAASAVSLSLTSFYTEELPKAYREVPSTRPFIYVLRDQRTELILFAGAVQDI